MGGDGWHGMRIPFVERVAGANSQDTGIIISICSV